MKIDKNLKRRIKRLAEKAEANWEEHRKLVKRTEDIINGNGIWDELLKLDHNFGRKVNHYPGDITTHRIAKTLSKLLDATE